MYIHKHRTHAALTVAHDPLFISQGKLLQLCLPNEVLPGTSKAQRSLATGHLLLTASKVPSRKAGFAAPAVEAADAQQAPAGSRRVFKPDPVQNDDSCFPELHADYRS